MIGDGDDVGTFEELGIEAAGGIHVLEGPRRMGRRGTGGPGGWGRGGKRLRFQATTVPSNFSLPSGSARIRPEPHLRGAKNLRPAPPNIGAWWGQT